MKNIEDAFTEKQLKLKLQKKSINDTQKSEAVPMLKNEYNMESEAYETKNSIGKWDVMSKSSSNKLDTARNMLSGTSRPGSGSQKSSKVAPAVLSEDSEEQAIAKVSYIGDTEVLNDESKRTNNMFNTLIFMTILGFIAFLTLFCCIYTYHQYSQSVIFSCLLMVIVASLVEVLILRPLTCLILTLITMIKRKVKSKEIMMREIEEVKEELGINKSQEYGSGKNIGLDSKEKLEKYSKSQDLEASKEEHKEESKSFHDSEEEKIETGKQENEMMAQLKQDSLLERMNERPKKESKSEAAKIARYNIKLLESIYQAYEPEQADNVVKVFRKGGAFSVNPIMEEDFEESFATENQDIESQGTTEVNAALIAAGGVGANKENAEGKGNKGKGDDLGDIKEENSQLLEEYLLDDDEKGKGGKNNLKLLKVDNHSEQTGYDFDKQDGNDIFKSQDEDSEFNALALAAIAGGGNTEDEEERKRRKNEMYEESSSEFDESDLGGATLNPKMRRRRRRRRRKDQPYNEKIRQLEEIYDNKGDSSVKVNIINISNV